jgi:phage terminase large subunit
VLGELGINATVCPNLPIADGIQAVRMLLPTCWFDKVKCKEGIEALRMYRRDWDDKRQEFRPNPLHDWTSHYADAMRYFAVGHQERATHKPVKRDTRWVV